MLVDGLFRLPLKYKIYFRMKKRTKHFGNKKIIKFFFFKFDLWTKRGGKNKNKY